MTHTPTPPEAGVAAARASTRREPPAPGPLVRAGAASAALLAIAPMPGCVVWEIRDEMRAANASMQEVRRQIDHTSGLIAQVHGRLDQTNTLVTGVDRRLHRLEVLDSIQASLAAVDEHLASLRRTIDNVDRAVPFMDVGDKAAPPPAPEEPADPRPPAPPPRR